MGINVSLTKMGKKVTLSEAGVGIFYPGLFVDACYQGIFNGIILAFQIWIYGHC